MDELQSDRTKREITANCQTGCGFFFLCCASVMAYLCTERVIFVGLNQLKRYKG